ncbi:MAG: hypothetical protein JO346_05180 [Alphaproteobacteria bacterium]|nr:hypothetical protein [Alphaproteobacteria bacterium]
MTTSYEYLTVTLARGRQSWADFAAHMRGVKLVSGEIVGVFQGQLGFASNEAVVLVRGGSLSLDGAPGVAHVTRETLTPTVRPADGAHLKSGGIYVHRWFIVDGNRVEDFVSLSNRAWTNFEGSYDTEIFGLFTAARSDSDRRDGAGRLLLLTWYASHGVWENSREQTNDPQSLFVQRHALTRTTIGRSSRTIPLAN